MGLLDKIKSTIESLMGKGERPAETVSGDGSPEAEDQTGPVISQQDR